jgi:hypothetical protein
MTDSRRRQWVPISVDVAHGSTGTALLRKFGPEGLLAWILFLAACKRGTDEGAVSYATEAEGLEALGLDSYAPSFTLASFFAYTGQGLKLTTKSHVGRLTVVRVKPDVWTAWNRSLRRQMDADRKTRSRSNGRDRNE